MQLGEEAQIEIDPTIGGTIERTGRGLAVAAAGFDRVTKQADCSGTVLAAEMIGPGRLDVVRDGIDEIDDPFFLR